MENFARSSFLNKINALHACMGRIVGDKSVHRRLCLHIVSKERAAVGYMTCIAAW